MKDYFLSRLTIWLWSLIVIALVTLAAYASLGNLLTSSLGQYREDLLRELNSRMEFVLEIDQLEGSWVSFTPRIQLHGLRLMGDAHAPVGLQVEHAQLEIDVLDSLLSGSIQFFALQASGVRVHVDTDSEGRLGLPGVPRGAGAEFGNPLYRFVANTHRLAFSDVNVIIHDEDSLTEVFLEAELGRLDDFRRVKISMQTPSRGSWFNIVAEGRGELDDFAEFEGEVHLESYLGQAQAYNDLLQQRGFTLQRGSVEAELWMQLKRGRVDVAARISADSLLLATAAEPDTLYAADAIKGTVRANYEEGVWNFAVKDLGVRGNGQQFEIPGLTGEYAGKSLVLRAAELQVAQLREYLVEGGLFTASAGKLLAELAPKGELQRLELALEDVTDLADWQLRANFSDLTLTSWRGAPGVENAAGYLSMNAQTGLVQLDSSDFSMSFPTLYAAPLTYQHFRAELAWWLDDQTLRIASGPFTGQGDEGEVRGLFGLTVPLQESAMGIEMDLLVGLTKAHPVHRNKYLPYTMSPGLLDWLAPSIGEGEIREAGFLWRGSLSESHYRTVQLFFQIENTELRYHPDWPALRELQGLVMIDGADVDVYAASARLLDSQVSDVRVQLRTDAQKHLQLSVLGTVLGSAGDGLAVVNDSPLRELVGDTFLDWQLEGALATRLDLQLDLSAQPIEAAVEVLTRWDSVRLDSGELGLVVDNISGDLWYRSDTGFSANALRGEIWGQPLRADISQGGGEGSLNDLDIALQARVELASVREWLSLEMLRFAQGGANAEVHIRVPASGAAQLQVDSDLLGVVLDLPRPWKKADIDAMNLRIEMPLADESRRLLLSLQQQLYLGLSLAESGVTGGSLGFGAPLPMEEDALLLLGGTVDRVNWDEWSGFVDSYLLDGSGSAGGATLLLGARDLTVTQLEMFGKTFADVQLNASQKPDSWQVEFATAWAAATVVLPNDLSRVQIAADFVDTAALSSGIIQAIDNLNPGGVQLPPIEVSIAELREGETPWGDLHFSFTNQAENYHFRDIRGRARGLQLGADQAMQLDWLAGGEKPGTHLSGELTFVDFGDVLASYNYEKVIETSSGKVDLDLSWPGSPTEFSLEATDGLVKIDVAKGRFLNTSGTTSGTLRVVSILNLADFVSRLSLDLSYIFESGVPFDSIVGDLHLKDGLIEVPGLDVTGRSSRFQFSGAADARQQSVDGDLVATLPIASNLPWMAALIAGLPVAAAVYVVSKVFTKQMDRFSSVSYHVTGPWDDPKVDFQSIFDDTSIEQAVAAEEVPQEAPANEQR